MPPDETDAATFYNSGRLGAPRVTYRIHNISEFVDSVNPADQSPPYFEGSTPENYWNGFSEDNFKAIAHILYLENAPSYMQHLNYIFDYGRSYSTWRDLWDNHRLTMVEIRNIIYSTISNMTVSQAGDMVRIISRALENIVGLNSYSIDFLARWANSLYMVYGDGSVGFPIVEDIYDYEVRVDPVEEVALNSPGVCNLNDLANAHAYNKNSSFVENIDKAPSEQEIWESLQRLHPGMMETIQYILDDCTIDYKESNKTKRIDKMKQEMVPRIKGVLTCMDDRLDHYDKHYLNKWLWELINFAIDCNGPIPYRRLAPNIKQWNQKEEPRIKKVHTSLHIIPRLSE